MIYPKIVNESSFKDKRTGWPLLHYHWVYIPLC